MLSPNFSPFPELSTERLLLREWRMSDASMLQQLRSNDEVMKHTSRPKTRTIEDAEKCIKEFLVAIEKNEEISWCICLKEAPDKHIGNISFARIEKANYRAEVAYMLMPEMQGKGIMYEALKAVMEYGFAEMKLHSMEALITPENAASAALLVKAGFVQEGYIRENYFLHGRFSDTVVYSKLTP